MQRKIQEVHETIEGIKRTTETIRNTTETIRTTAETVTKTAETLRKRIETVLKTAEAIHIATEKVQFTIQTLPKLWFLRLAYPWQRRVCNACLQLIQVLPRYARNDIPIVRTEPFLVAGSALFFDLPLH